MKSKFEKLIYKIGVIGFIHCVLDSSTSSDWGYTGRYRKKHIKSSDGLIVLETSFKYDSSSAYKKNEYEIETNVSIKDFHYMDFKLYFNQHKKANVVTLYDFLYDREKIDDSNYVLISDVIFKTPWKCTYKQWMNVEIPEWVNEEIEIMYQEQIGRLNNTFKKNRLEQFINNRDVRYVEITDKQKKVLYLLGNVLSDIYQEESGQLEKLNRRDQLKCLELLKNVILPMIGDQRDEEELESIIEEASKKVNQNIESRGKTLSLEDKSGDI